MFKGPMAEGGRRAFLELIGLKRRVRACPFRRWMQNATVRERERKRQRKRKIQRERERDNNIKYMKYRKTLTTERGKEGKGKEGRKK